MLEKGDVKVSVCVCTYNQQELIGICLDSILAQQTDFSFEIIIGDDASPDNTLEIVNQYRERFPGIIKVVSHAVNVGATQNLQDVHLLAKGQYVAHCDGDDYFLPGKLQRQANFLDQNPEVVQVWHRMRLIDKGNNIIGNLPRRFPGWMNKKLSVKDLAIAYFMIGFHSSLMYRRSAKSIYDRTNFTIDYFYALDVASKGYSAHMNEYLGCYRTVPNSSLTTSSASMGKVDTAVAEAAQFFSEKDPGLIPFFYGNLWFKKKLIKYAGSGISDTYEKIFQSLKQKGHIFYGLKSMFLYLSLYSSLNPRILTKWSSKIISKKKVRI